MDEAAEELAPGKAGSVKRRLYDIINVLLTLDLVEKVLGSSLDRALFFLGPTDFWERRELFKETRLPVAFREN